MKEQNIIAQKVLDTFKNSISCAEALSEAINKAGYELKKKELEEEKTFYDYIHKYITCKYNAYEIHHILQYEILIRNETEKLKNVIKRLTFEQCCGILKMICEDKFHTHFWSFLRSVNNPKAPIPELTDSIVEFIGDQFLEKIINPKNLPD